MEHDLIYLILKLVDRHKGIVSRGLKNKRIGICSEWRGTKGREAFVRWSLKNGFSPELELDRIDPKGSYSPENCQYISAEENRVKDSRKYLYKGKRHTLKELHKIVNSPVAYKTMITRRFMGWNLSDSMLKQSQRKSYG